MRHNVPGWDDHAIFVSLVVVQICIEVGELPKGVPQSMRRGQGRKGVDNEEWFNMDSAVHIPPVVVEDRGDLASHKRSRVLPGARLEKNQRVTQGRLARSESHPAMAYVGNAHAKGMETILTGVDSAMH